MSGYIREKLLDFKRRLSDRKMYSIIIVILAAVAIFGIYQYKQRSELQQQLDNQYNRAFYEMNGYVHNVEPLLVKALVASSPSATAATLQEAWRQANLAQANLGQLPVSQEVLANTSKFLTQVGDLSYAINRQNMDGKPLSDEQYKTLEQLNKYAVALSDGLNGLQDQLSSGRIKWGELAGKGTSVFLKTSSDMPQQQFENVDKVFQDTPKLIYDGPFSDHMVTAEPRGVTGDMINVEQAKAVVSEFFGADKVRTITETGKNDNGAIKTFSFSVNFKNVPDSQTASIDVTQKGGHIFWMLYNRPVAAPTLNIDQAKAQGRSYLEKHGLKSMADTYYLKEDGTATVNYAYQQDKVTVYSDLIKLKIALDNGEVVGFESKGYLSAHTARTIPSPGITLDQARAKINPKVTVSSSGLALIPTEFKTEIFTYEFKGKLNDRDLLIYINAMTGKEENILMIINTPNGILTL